MQLSHIFNNDNIFLRYTKPITETSFKKILCTACKIAPTNHSHASFILHAPQPNCASINFHVICWWFTLLNVDIVPAIYHKLNTPTEPSRLHVIPSQPLVTPQVLASRGPLKIHRSGNLWP